MNKHQYRSGVYCAALALTHLDRRQHVCESPWKQTLEMKGLMEAWHAGYPGIMDRRARDCRRSCETASFEKMWVCMQHLERQQTKSGAWALRPLLRGARRLCLTTEMLRTWPQPTAWRLHHLLSNGMPRQQFVALRHHEVSKHLNGSLLLQYCRRE